MPLVAVKLLPVVIAGLALGGVAFGAVLIDSGYAHTDDLSGVLELFVGWSFIGVGLYAWGRRPANRIGPLMIATGYLWFVALLGYSSDATVYTLAGLLAATGHATLIHLLLAFPSGRLETPTARLTAVATYGVFIGGNLLVWLFSDPATEFGCDQCADNLVQIVHSGPLADATIALVNVLAAAVVAYVFLLVVLRWRKSQGWRRRALTPLLFCAAATALVLSGTFLMLPISADAAGEIWVDGFALVAAVPYAYLVGLVRSAMLSRAAAGELVARLTEAHGCGQAREVLRWALGDPSLELGMRLPDSDVYVNAEDREVDLAPAGDDGRACALVEVDGAPVAAILYDAALVDDPQLVESVRTASALAVERHQLDAELRAKMEELRASRERIVEAGFEERRRLERNLHDGAQQRFVSLALSLRLARSRLDSDPSAAGELLDEATRELQHGLADLRDLARGIHPAVLTDCGLDAAVAGLADRAPFEVNVEGVPEGRLPEKVESAAYFVVSEALTNSVKHAGASCASIRMRKDNGALTVEVADDGVGGADLAAGSGLRGLVDRVAALDGRLEVDSRPGEGTTLRASIPVRRDTDGVASAS
jgi:signal transduction histidine kinase